MKLLFWRKEPEEIAKEHLELNKQKLVHEDKVFNVGMTTVMIMFNDGREVHSKIYGSVYQYVCAPRTAKDIYQVSEPMVSTSEETYKHWLHNLQAHMPTKVFDDSINPTVAWTGIITHMEIYETVKYEIHHTVTRLVNVEEDKCAGTS